MAGVGAQGQLAAFYLSRHRQARDQQHHEDENEDENRVLAMAMDAPATPMKPKRPAIKPITRKMSAQRNMGRSFLFGVEMLRT